MTLLIIISALLYSSLVEYCIHRFVQHSSYEKKHIKEHHRIFHGIKSYEAEDGKPEDIISGFKDNLEIGIVYLLPAVMLFNQNIIYLLLFVVVCFLYNFWGERVHLYSHISKNGFIERLEVFKKLKEHHRVHHYIYYSNYGVGTTFWDRVFRTKKAADKEYEVRVAKRLNIPRGE